MSQKFKRASSLSGNTGDLVHKKLKMEIESIRGDNSVPSFSARAVNTFRGDHVERAVNKNHSQLVSDSECIATVVEWLSRGQ